jgi:hypothetical protein
MENGHEIGNMECEECLYGRLTEELKENYRVELSGSTEVQTGKRGTQREDDYTLFSKYWNEDN